MPNMRQGTPEARGLGQAGNLGKNIAKAMNNAAFQPKKNARAGKQVIVLPNQPKSSASVIPSHRYKRYFGIRTPGSF